MARIRKIALSLPAFWRQLLWKTALIILVIILLIQIIIIWVNGGKETDDAFSSGRRLVIPLSDLVIQGKIISSVSIATAETQPKPEVEAETESKVEVKAEPESSSEVNEPAVEEQLSLEKPPETNETKIEDKEKKKEDEVISTLTIVSDEADEKDEPLPTIIPSQTPPEQLSPKVSEKTEFGTLPKISDKGLKPWKYYSKPVKIKDKKPLIAIIVANLGKNKRTTELALRLPEVINLSFSPYANDIDNWLTSARISGHETLIDLPMEASNYPASDPGPLGLLISKDQTENENKIKKLMAHDSGFIGFLTPRNEVFLENNELFKSLLQVLAGRGLALAVAKTPAKNETKDIIEGGNTASIIIDTFIDEELTQTSINARLSLLEQLAKQRGYAVGLAQDYPISITQLNEWAAKAEEKGFNLVPVSSIIAKRY